MSNPKGMSSNDKAQISLPATGRQMESKAQMIKAFSIWILAFELNN